MRWDTCFSELRQLNWGVKSKWADGTPPVPKSFRRISIFLYFFYFFTYSIISMIFYFF